MARFTAEGPGSVLANPFELRGEGPENAAFEAYQAYFEAIIAGASPFAAADSLFENRPWLKKASGWKVPLRSEFMEAISHPKEIDANSYQLY
jgi:hypothetical protein